MKTLPLALPLILFIAQWTVEVSGKLDIGCYFASWQPKGYDLKSVPENKCDYLYYAFITIDTSTWKVKDENDYLKFSPKELKKLSPNTKVLAALGGYDAGVTPFSNLVTNKDNRATFISDVVSYLILKDYDGMDIDWEFPGDTDRGGKTTDKDNLVLFVKELRQAFMNSANSNLLLTMAVATYSGIVDNAYDVKALATQIDWFNVMTYDMRGPWTNTADNHAPLYRRSFDTGSSLKMNVNDSMSMYTDLGSPANKLVMGIPFYARSFTLKFPSNTQPNAPITGPGNKGDDSNETGILYYSEVCQFIKSGNWQKGFDQVAKVPYIYTGDQWAGYDDESSIKTKMQFAKDNGYKGAMAWVLYQDDYLGNCGDVKHPLLVAMNNNS